MWQRELESRLHQLLNVGAADICRLLNLDNADDLNNEVRTMKMLGCLKTYVDGPETGTMPSGHILVHALDSICTCQLAELLVHVMCSGTGVVAQPDTKVLDFQRFLFVNLRGRQRWSAE